MKEFTEKELNKYDGREGRTAYIAYRGEIYDVTGSFLWKNGKHQVTHRAGKDLTPELEKAPHGADFLRRFPVVGRLKKRSLQKD